MPERYSLGRRRRGRAPFGGLDPCHKGPLQAGCATDLRTGSAHLGRNLAYSIFRQNGFLCNGASVHPTTSPRLPQVRSTSAVRLTRSKRFTSPPPRTDISIENCLKPQPCGESPKLREIFHGCRIVVACTEILSRSAGDIFAPPSSKSRVAFEAPTTVDVTLIAPLASAHHALPHRCRSCTALTAAFTRRSTS